MRLSKISTEPRKRETGGSSNPTIERCRRDSKDDSKEKSQEDSWTIGFE